MARGRGMSQYSGLRVAVVQTPGSDMAQVLVKGKSAKDGWDEWTYLVASEQIFCGPITSTDSAIEVTRDFLDALLAELRRERWGPE